MARSSALVAEGRGLSPKGRVPRSSRLLASHYRALLAAPTAELVLSTQQTILRTLDRAGSFAASALSPFENHRNRCDDLRDGQTVMGNALLLIDACSRLPVKFLRARGLWEGTTVREMVAMSVRLVRVLVATLDRAAAELGLPAFDGGPFALPGGAR